MSDTGGPAPEALRSYRFEFRGTGGEYFRIWIVNLALTVLTLGIYSAWATVRTRRYFRGNTVLADHAFDYHASPLRILIGRAIALTLLIGYNISAAISPYTLLFWLPAFLAALPWLINSSTRFNARNTSYRNVRFNFTGRYGGALKAYILWPLLGVLTGGILMPLARKVRDYYYINHHTYGGRPFETNFSAWRIFFIFLIAFVLWIAIFAAVAAGIGALFVLAPHTQAMNPKNPAAFQPIFFAIVIVVEIAAISVGVMVMTMIFNLVISHTVLDGRHRLRSRLSPPRVIWILITNILLTMLTLGIYYPWAQVRITRYRLSRLSLEAASDLDEFTSETFGTQGAVGEEIAGFFDLDFGL